MSSFGMMTAASMGGRRHWDKSAIYPGIRLTMIATATLFGRMIL